MLCTTNLCFVFFFSHRKHNKIKLICYIKNGQMLCTTNLCFVFFFTQEAQQNQTNFLYQKWLDAFDGFAQPTYVLKKKVFLFTQEAQNYRTNFLYQQWLDALHNQPMLKKNKIPGVFTRSEPHQTISNLVVKRFRSDNTCRAACWEDSLMPGNHITAT